MWSYRNLPTIRRKYCLDVQSEIFRHEGSRNRQQLSYRLYTSCSCSLVTQFNDQFLSITSANTGSSLDITLKNSIVAMCVAVNTQTILPAEFVGIMFVVCLKFHLPVCGVSVFAAIKPKAKKYIPFSGRVIFNSRNYNYVRQLFCSHNISLYIHIYRVSRNLRHKLFLGIPHPQLSKNVPINMGPKVNRFRDIAYELLHTLPYAKHYS